MNCYTICEIIAIRGITFNAKLITSKFLSKTFIYYGKKRFALFSKMIIL